MNRFANLRIWAARTLRHPKVGLGIGLATAALAGAPMPLPQLALLGPLVATCAAGAWGGRGAALVGFLSFLAFGHPDLGAAALALGIAALVGWAVPRIVTRALETEDDAFSANGRESDGGASAVVIDCEGFASLDETYGPGTSLHVFNMLHRALKTETRESDLVVNTYGQELVLVLDGSNPAVAQSVMDRVERRFAGWLTDAGYECNLTVGLSTGDVRDDEIEAMMRAARHPNGEPYLD